MLASGPLTSWSGRLASSGSENGELHNDGHAHLEQAPISFLEAASELEKQGHCYWVSVRRLPSAVASRTVLVEGRRPLVVIKRPLLLAETPGSKRQLPAQCV